VNPKNSSWHGGKGSARRKSSSQEKYAQGWDLIFAKKKREKPEKIS
jgi:hypothetical protein